MDTSSQNPDYHPQSFALMLPDLESPSEDAISWAADFLGSINSITCENADADISCSQSVLDLDFLGPEVSTYQDTPDLSDRIGDFGDQDRQASSTEPPEYHPTIAERMIQDQYGTFINYTSKNKPHHSRRLDERGYKNLRPAK
ncbi:hypothetical protein ABW19_dt0200437 [Dactylella cylindrospora]|nr:hypothetical protein ABW19_dt0200437 [Dactylella cylindrospora]